MRHGRHGTHDDASGYSRIIFEELVSDVLPVHTDVLPVHIPKRLALQDGHSSQVPTRTPSRGHRDISLMDSDPRAGLAPRRLGGPWPRQARRHWQRQLGRLNSGLPEPYRDCDCQRQAATSLLPVPVAVSHAGSGWPGGGANGKRSESSLKRIRASKSRPSSESAETDSESPALVLLGSLPVSRRIQFRLGAPACWHSFSITGMAHRQRRRLSGWPGTAAGQCHRHGVSCWYWQPQVDSDSDSEPQTEPALCNWRLRHSGTATVTGSPHDCGTLQVRLRRLLA